MAKKLALGKGMASLIQKTPNELLAKSLIERQEHRTENLEAAYSPLLLPIEDILPNPHQPRKIFKKKELDELAQSIRESGILVPLMVTKSDKGYQLMAGERRLRAAQKVGLKKVPVIIKNATEKEQIIISIVENIQRSNLNCIEEALAYSSLMDEFHLTQEEVAKNLGKERSTVANFLRILKLPPPIIDFLQKDQLSFGHAKVLASVKDEYLAVNIAKEAVAKVLSVREVEDFIKRITKTDKTDKQQDLDSIASKQMNRYRDKIEQKTGLHCGLKITKNGSGQIILKFSNETEFNNIYEFLMGRQNLFQQS